jgi:hypothetical protein
MSKEGAEERTFRNKPEKQGTCIVSIAVVFKNFVLAGDDVFLLARMVNNASLGYRHVPVRQGTFGSLSTIERIIYLLLFLGLGALASVIAYTLSERDDSGY